MKKALCVILAALLIGATALAGGAPQLSGSLFSAAKQAVGYLASGEYERLVTLIHSGLDKLSLLAPEK